MSRIGKQPIAIPAGVTVSVQDGGVLVKGKLGELTFAPHAGITVEVKDGQVVVTRADDSLKSFHGTARAVIQNMVIGVSQGYHKGLEISGTGFKAAVNGKVLVLTLGFASPKEYKIPDGVKIAVDKDVNISVDGIDKALVGEAAARIRAYYPAEPYKGKGIKYAGEKIRRKVGKKVA